MRIWPALASLGLALLLIAACGGGSGGVELPEPRFGSLSGIAVDAGGRPAAHVPVELCSTRDGQCLATSTDDLGAFEFVAPLGAYRLRFMLKAEAEPVALYYQRANSATDRVAAASPILVTAGTLELGRIEVDAGTAEGSLTAPATPTSTPTPTPVPTRVRWLDGEWFLLGVNLPWVHWSCDFGVPSPSQPEFCAPDASASSSATQAILRPRFQALQAADVHVVRWWVFPDQPWQILRDEEGLPAGLVDSIFPDFEAALALAETYDLYYVFTLFSSPSVLPAEWRYDPAAREALADSLRPLFALYADNDRVLSWEIFNEPEWEIWGGSVSVDNVRAVVGAIADAVHDSSNAYVSVGSVSLDGIGSGACWDSTTTRPIGTTRCRPLRAPYARPSRRCSVERTSTRLSS